MIQRISKELQRRSSSQGGFTLIELLVVIVILAILAAVVVFAVQGTGDKGQAAALETDARTLRTAQETHCAQVGRYAASDAELVAAGFLSEESSYHEVVSGGFGRTSCGSYLTDAQNRGFGLADQVDVVKLASFNFPQPGGFPSPFAFGQGPGFNNMHYIFDSLTWKDATGNHIPWLATSLGNVSGDGLTVTYTLRDNVRFSNGDPLTAEDVAFTFDYIRPGGTYSAGANLPGTFYYSLEYISSVTASGANPATGVGGTVTFTLTSPFVPFEAMIGSRIPIIPQGIWSTVTNPAVYGSPTDGSRNTPDANEVTPAMRAVTGSGPYMLENPGAFPDAPPEYAFVAKSGSAAPMAYAQAQYTATSFFLGTPFVRRLEYTPAGSDQLTAITGGTIDAGQAPDGVAPPASLDRIEAPGENVRAIHFNLNRGFPYNEVAFRQAVAHALDRKQLVANVLGGRGEVGSMGGLAPSHFLANPNLPTYERDLAKAGQLLDSLDIRDTAADSDTLRELPCSPAPCTRTNFTPTIRSQAAATDATNQLVDGYLSDIGIDAIIEPGVVVPQFTSGNYNIGMLSYGAMGAEADQLRNRLSFSDTNLQFTDVYGWNNPEFEMLAYEQVGERDPTVRRQKIFRMQELVAQDVPLISLYLPTRAWVYSPSKPVPWYLTPGGLWAGWPWAPNKQVFVVGKRTGLP